MVLGSGNFFAPSVGSFQVPVVAPDVDPDEGQLMTVCFNPAWLPFVLGALQQLTLQATWSGDDAAVLLAQSRAQTLLAMVGSPDGGCSDVVCFSGLRYDADTDTVQQTFDGGMSYVDNPGADPRHATPFQFPPVGGDDPKCQAAARMTRFISDLISEVISVVDTAGEAEGLAALLLALFVELGPFGILIDLVLALAAILFGAGSLALADAFTSTVYDTLTCIFFCNVESDGSVTAADVSAILDQVNTQIGGLVYDVLAAMFFLMGEVGLSNAGTIGDPLTPDCSGCTDCAYCVSYSAADGWGDWEARDGNATFDGTNWVSVVSGANVICSIKLMLASAINVGHVEVTFNAGDVAGGGFRGVYFNDMASVPPSASTDLCPFAGVNECTLDYSYTTDYIGMNVDSSPSASTNYITKVVVRGTGTPPPGGTACV
jgi:hypothetical protein